MGLRARPRVGRCVRQPSAAGWGRGHVVIVHSHAAPWRPVSMKQPMTEAVQQSLGQRTRSTTRTGGCHQRVTAGQHAMGASAQWQ
jgi:hypothetical protein